MQSNENWTLEKKHKKSITYVTELASVSYQALEHQYELQQIIYPLLCPFHIVRNLIVQISFG